MSKASVKIGRKVIFTFAGKDFNSRQEVKAFVAKEALASRVNDLIGKQGVPAELATVPAEALGAFVLNLFAANLAKKTTKRAPRAAKVSTEAKPVAAKAPKAAKVAKPAKAAVETTDAAPKKRGPKPGSKRKSAVVLPPPPAI